MTVPWACLGAAVLAEAMSWFGAAVPERWRESGRSTASQPTDGDADQPATPLTGRSGLFANVVLRQDGRKRTFRLFVPATYDPGRPAPLVFNFHGLTSHKTQQANFSRLEETAARHEFLVATPNGLDRRWDVFHAPASNDDVKFFDAVLAEVRRHYRVDALRIYGTGMSMGAFFACYVGLARSTVVAAIAPHSGWLARQGAPASAGPPHRRVPVLLIHGDADRIVPVERARQARDWYRANGHEVEYIEVPGLGHRWAHAIDINEKIWAFFLSHPLPPAGSPGAQSRASGR